MYQIRLQSIQTVKYQDNIIKRAWFSDSCESLLRSTLLISERCLDSIFEGVLSRFPVSLIPTTRNLPADRANDWSAHRDFWTG